MVEFDEIELRNEFIETIRNGFAEYYDLLGVEVQVESEEPQEASFPCCITKIVNPISDKRYDDGDNSFNVIRFSLECDLFSDAIDDYSATDSVAKLSQMLINIILSKYKEWQAQRFTNQDVDKEKKKTSSYPRRWVSIAPQGHKNNCIRRIRFLPAPV